MKTRVSGIASILAILLFTHTCVAQAATHQGILAWGTSPTPGSVYTVKRSTTPGGPYTTIKTGLLVLTYTDTGLSATTKFCWVVTAVAQTFAESQPSNEVCATTGQDQTASPGALSVVVQ